MERKQQTSRAASDRKRWQRPATWLVAGGLVAGGGTVYWGQNFVRQRLPGYLEGRLSTALGRRVEVGSVSFWPLGAFSVQNVTVAGDEGTRSDLLQARRLRAYVSWWDLILHQRLAVTELHVDDGQLASRIDLRDTGRPGKDPTEALQALWKIGLRRIGVHNTNATVQAVLPSGDTEPVAAKKLDVVLDLAPQSFSYRANAGEWSGAGITAQAIGLAGSANSDTVTVRQGKASVEGGNLNVAGAYQTRAGDVTLKVQAKDLPLARLAAQLGIPREWGMQGRLTGTMDVSAASGELQRLNGTLNLSRGSVTRGADSKTRVEFPWTQATAKVDYGPQGVSLSGIDVQGEGIRLQGVAKVAAAPAAITQRAFTANGTVNADSAAAIQKLAALLAFGVPSTGRWEMERGQLAFQANGVVGDVANARATGNFELANLRIRPEAGRNALLVNTVRGTLERRETLLLVDKLRATAEGMEATGALAVTPGGEGRVGVYQGNTTVHLTSLATVRNQLANFPIWNWLAPEQAASRGTVVLRARGPIAAPTKFEGSGTFRFQEFAANIPTGNGDERWRVPIRELTGQLSGKNGALGIQNVALKSDLFTGTGSGTVRDVLDIPKPSGEVHLTSNRWAELPPLRRRLPAGLQNGTLVVDARMDNSTPRRVTGQASLAGATYRFVPRGSTTTRVMPVNRAEARFVASSDTVTVPRFELVTPQLRTTGSLAARHQAEGWRLLGDGVLTADDTGAALRLLANTDAIRGGKLNAKYSIESPVGNMSNPAVSARVLLTDAQPMVPPGSLPIPAKETHIESLAGLVRLQNGQVSFSEGVLKANGFSASGDGALDQGRMDARLRVVTPRWRELAGNLATSLPVQGGVMVIEGAFNGPVDQVKTIPVDGTVAIRGARLAAAGSIPAPVRGGVLDLRTRVRGPLNQLVRADLDGTISLRDAIAPAWRTGAKPMPIEEARAEFRKRGDTVTLSDLVASTPGARLTGEGEMRGLGTQSATHRLSLKATGSELAKVLPAIAPVPGNPAGGKFEANLSVRGTARDPLAEMEGNALASNGSWTPPGQTAALPIERFNARFARKGGALTIPEVDLRVEGGQAHLSGFVGATTASGAGKSDLKLTWLLEDASAWVSRMLPVPGGFTGGRLTGEARLTGPLSNVAQTASGRFELRDTGFMPPKKFLDGPVRPISVAWARGIFKRGNGQTVLQDLDLNSSIGTATGRVVASDKGTATIDAKANLAKLDDLLDLWPGFKDKVRGGSGEMTVALQGPLRRPTELAGVVTIAGRNGVLHIEHEDPLYANQPFDELSTVLRLASSGQVKLEKITMSGPKANLRGTGLVSADGKISGKGEAWFSEQYTRQLIKPPFLRPIARLVGIKRIKSRYEVHGTLRKARLDLGITDSLLWKLAIKNKVPQPLRKIATGDAPLWDADAPAAPITAPLPRRTAGR